MTDILRRMSQAQPCDGRLCLLCPSAGLLTGAGGWLVARTGGSASLAWAPLAAGVVGGVSSAWPVAGLVRASIKAPVEDTAMAVMRIAKGDLETRIESPGPR